jgi:transposase
MSVTTIVLDLAKSVFQFHVVDAQGRASLKRRIRRRGLLAFFEELPPCLVGMEACSSAHHWARELVALGHDVRLIPPQYAKPYVKRNKTDAADAEAICEAVSRPNMRFVPIKSRLLTLHRVRSLLVRQRTATVNTARGLLSEFGIVAAKGIGRVDALRRDMEVTSEEVLPREARVAVDALFEHFDALRAKLDAVNQEIFAWHRASETSQRLATAPGVGPLTATALIAAIGDASQFASARHFAAWLGLTPRMSARKSRAHRKDQQGRGSLPANASDPWRTGDDRRQLPSRNQAAPLASGGDSPASGQRCGGGRRAQDGTGALGHDPA